MSKLNKKSKKILLIFIPLLVIIILIAFYIGKKNDEKGNNEPSTQYEYTYRKVYLNSKDDTLVPLSVKYRKIDNLGEDIHYTLSLIKENSPICNEVFNGIIPEDCAVNNIDLNDEGILTINFDENFKNYEAKHELKLLESIAWTMTEFDEVTNIKLMMEDEVLTNMPVKNTPVPETLNRSIGINNYMLTSTYFNDGVRVLSYYEKDINNQAYLVPVTHYVKPSNSLTMHELTINKLLERPAISSRLKVASALKDVALTDETFVKDNVLMVSINEKALFDEGSVNLEVYEIIRASLQLLDDVNDVSFVVDEVELPVNGLNKDEVISVNSFIFNEYYI